MPNWCYNKVTFTGEKPDLDKVEELLRSDGWGFNLNACVPYPENYALMDKEHKEFGYFHSSDNSDDEKVSLREAYIEKWGTEQDGYNYGGYGWCVDNWGTKWNISEAHWEMDGNRLVVNFDSAWSPPCEALGELAIQYPNLKIRIDFEEPGCRFRGYCEWADGELWDQSMEDNYPETDEEWVDRVDYEIEKTEDAIRKFDNSPDGQRYLSITGMTLWDSLGGEEALED